MHCTVTLGIVVKCVHATMVPDLQASALDLVQWEGLETYMQVLKN